MPLEAGSVARGNIVPADQGVWQEQVLAGTVSLTMGSVIVTGTNTTFSNALQVRQWLVFASDLTQTPYRIIAIANDTDLTLASPYVGATTASTQAAIIEDLGPVPPKPTAPVTETSCACTCEDTPLPPRPRYYPELVHSPITFSNPEPILFKGTVSLTKGSNTMTGTGTSFTKSLCVGQWLVFEADLSQTPYQI